MLRALALTSLMVAVVAADAFAQRSRSRSTGLTDSAVETRIEKLETGLRNLRARVATLESDLQTARDEADAARDEADAALAANADLQARVDDLESLLSGITIAGDAVTVRTLTAQRVNAEVVDADEYEAGAGNLW